MVVEFVSVIVKKFLMKYKYNQVGIGILTVDFDLASQPGSNKFFCTF